MIANRQERQIIGRRRLGGKFFHLGMKRVADRRGASRRIERQALQRSRQAKLSLAAILRLRNAIGNQEQNIAVTQPQPLGRIAKTSVKAKRRSASAIELPRRLPWTKQNRRVVASVAKFDLTGPAIDDADDGRDEHGGGIL